MSVDQLDLGLSPEQPAPTSPPPRKAPVEPRVCWACGIGRPMSREKYCRGCITRGLDTPIISCRIEGCTYVSKRRWPGQEFFFCPDHRQARP